MASVLEHLQRIADALASGHDADIGCGALIDSWLSAGSEESGIGGQFQTAVGPASDGLAEFARDHLADVDKQAWHYVDGALAGDYDALQQLMQRIPGYAEVRLLRKMGTNSIEKICIGRGKRNDVIIHDDAISSIHAQIEALDGDRATIVDCKSSNGTFVNNVRLEAHTPMPLASGDSVRLGHHLLYYLGRDSLRLFLKLRLAEALRTYRKE